MTTIAFPTLSRAAPREFDFGLISNTQKFESPLNRSVQTGELPGARWAAQFGYENLTDADAALLQAFFAKLRGQAGRFYLYNFARQAPRGVATGTPLAAAASTTVLLKSSGWTAGVTGILKAGDFIGCGGELKIVTADVNSNGSGLADIPVEPPFRTVPSVSAAIAVNKPTATFMLTEDTSRWLTRPGKFTDFNLQAVEVFA